MVELKKVLNFPVLLLIVINSIMGTGIYFLPAVGARYSGPMSIISWLIMSVIAIYISMCFAELVSMFPKAGGVYEYSKQAYGRFSSFMIGWITLIAGNLTIAMLVVGAIQYLLPYNLPVEKVIISLMFILAFNYVAYKGMKTSSFMLITFAVLTLAAAASLIIPGLVRMQPSNFRPFFVFPVSAVFITVYFIQETFFGWESATFLAEETKDPEKTMPKALIIGTICIAVLSLLFVISSLGNIHWQAFSGSAAPLSDLGAFHFGSLGRVVFTLWIYLAIIGAVASWVVSAPRLILAMARDRLFLTQFSEIHPKYHTPHHAIMIQAVLTSILVIAGVGAYRTLLLMLLPFILIMYVAVLLALVSLRFSKPRLRRPYKAPFGTVGPIIISFIMIALLFAWIVIEETAIKLLMLSLSVILLGVPFYLLLELYYNPKAVRKTNNILAYLVLWTEDVSLPKDIRKEMIHTLGDIKGRSILEFGCSVGTLTLPLAEAVGRKGKVYATDISERDIRIAAGRLKKKGHKHVRVIHDLNHHYRVHPDVPSVHAAVSTGTIGCIKNIGNVLAHMNRRMKKGSKVCFLDYDKFFDIIPNREWLSDDKKIKRIFKKAGFKVAIRRKQGFAWKYIFIFGEKVKSLKKG
ncbi:amino acid permease [Candidatus Woesearchaeota archaeon]|nr:amino acid permease [Candidatus Woesearchaeota archaeon]